MPHSDLPENANHTTTFLLQNANGDIELNSMVEKNGKELITSNNTNYLDPEKGKELRVYYTGDSNFRKRTKLEKYLIALCIFLLLATATFMVLVIVRESKKGKV